MPDWYEVGQTVFVCHDCYGPAIEADAVLTTTMRHLVGGDNHPFPWDRA